jgi:outer membrane protein assembly factor BamB
VTKDNHYSDDGSYCDDETYCPSDRTATHPNYPEQYFITQLNPSMGVEWQWQNTNPLSCSRDSSGNVTCVNDHPHGFEFCVNVMAIAGDGTIFANSEDGNMYAVSQGGTLRDHLFQQLALGAAYTPAAIAGDGKIISQNAGHLYVLGN